MSLVRQSRIQRLCRQALFVWAVIVLMVTGAYPQEFDLSNLPSYQPAMTEPTNHCHNDKCRGE